MAENVKEEILRCSFCIKSQREVKKLIAGPGVFICDGCVDICLDIISEDRALELQSKSTTSEQIEQELDRFVVGQTRAKHAFAVVIRNHKMKMDSRDKHGKANVLLLGPPGTGKTLMVRRLAASLQRPCIIVDATRLTGLSYFKNESIIENLYQEAGKDRAIAEEGVVCIDQLDRIVSRASRDAGQRVQESLLEILEGSRVPLEKSGGTIDTSRMLFVGCGIFLTPKGSLTGAERRQVLIDSGFLPEFIDRFPTVIEFEHLSELDLETLLARPGGLLDEYRALFENDRVDLKISDDAMEAIAKEAGRLGGGARSLRAILESLTLEISFVLTAETRPTKFTVDEAFVTSLL